MASAASTSARCQPNVRLIVAARVAREAAIRASTRPLASVSMCPASASSASDPEISPPITSATNTAAVIASTRPSRFRCAPAAVTP